MTVLLVITIKKQRLLQYVRANSFQQQADKLAFRFNGCVFQFVTDLCRSNPFRGQI